MSLTTHGRPGRLWACVRRGTQNYGFPAVDHKNVRLNTVLTRSLTFRRAAKHTAAFLSTAGHIEGIGEEGQTVYKAEAEGQGQAYCTSPPGQIVSTSALEVRKLSQLSVSF